MQPCPPWHRELVRHRRERRLIINITELKTSEFILTYFLYSVMGISLLSLLTLASVVLDHVRQHESDESDKHAAGHCEPDHRIPHIHKYTIDTGTSTTYSHAEWVQQQLTQPIVQWL